MQSNEYDRDYFRETRFSAGLMMKTMRPLWWRWLKIIRSHKPSGRLLDVGCGEGYFLQYAEKYYETYGVDVSGYCIGEARLRAEKSKLYVGEIEKIEYEDKRFDVVTCFDVLEHLRNPEVAIKECRRVLKKGGIFVVRVPNTSSLGRRLKKDNWFGYRDKTHVSLLSDDDWLKLLQRNMFEILEVFYDGLWDIPYVQYVPRVFQDIFIKYPSLVFFLAGIHFLRGRYGENLCVILRRS